MGPSPSAIKGKWLRYEIVVHNAAPTGPGTTFEVFLKNVTDNQPEIRIIDSSVAEGQWTTALATMLHPTATISTMTINGYRAGSCTGFAAYSHYLAAAWSTDSGQRIGAAHELEGMDSVPPAPPTNVRVVL